MYKEEDMLMLSGIQHYVFCPRQWALIHIDQVWRENYLTIEGEYQHKNTDNPAYRGIQKDVKVIRRMSLSSKKIGMYGFADIVELHDVNDVSKGIYFEQYNKYLLPYPVEYKHGKPKVDDSDIMQLVCQVICIEERYGITIDEAALYYWKTRHRMRVTIDDELRKKVISTCSQMHDDFQKGVLPQPPENLMRCGKCSLKDICEPKIQRQHAASNYIIKNLYEETS